MAWFRREEEEEEEEENETHLDQFFDHIFQRSLILRLTLDPYIDSKDGLILTLEAILIECRSGALVAGFSREFSAIGLLPTFKAHTGRLRLVDPLKEKPTEKKKKEKKKKKKNMKKEKEKMKKKSVWTSNAAHLFVKDPRELLVAMEKEEKEEEEKEEKEVEEEEEEEEEGGGGGGGKEGTNNEWTEKEEVEEKKEGDRGSEAN
ncbi:hypothetical protein HZH66_013405 [Vespula vulgaris]|uniref:Uncharacterized protein n=1 Tax=Vespula vulgaris TaxID=7454 RepID=A0A834J4X2_VESVU|nr:hypothetical protein HZH66_013405 [Vespula vulgaris]